MKDGVNLWIYRQNFPLAKDNFERRFFKTVIYPGHYPQNDYFLRKCCDVSDGELKHQYYKGKPN